MIIKLSQKPLLKYPDLYVLSHLKKILALTLLSILISCLYVDLLLSDWILSMPLKWRLVIKNISISFSPVFVITTAPVLYLVNKFLWKQQKIASFAYHMIFIGPICVVVCKCVKHLLQRCRPLDLIAMPSAGMGWMSAVKNPSFPSSHACMAGAIAGMLACFYPKHSWKFFATAFFLALCRVFCLKHFLSDVIAGLVIGLIVSQSIHLLSQRKQILL
ncbi:MAG: phosphatase PAP2 family protein [Chlamydiae bacterium]|nr:phosphatase PAP2 family protein [Chlamydiota bacterium]